MAQPANQGVASLGRDTGAERAEAQGHRPLYTGTDLRGWNCRTPDRWKASDWQLVLSEGPPTEPLWTDREFGDAEFILDCLPGQVPPSVIIRGADAKTVLPLDAGQTGKWGRYTITIKSGEATVQFGGGEAKRVPLDGAEGRRIFGLGGAGAKFANLYAREL